MKKAVNDQMYQPTKFRYNMNTNILLPLPGQSWVLALSFHALTNRRVKAIRIIEVLITKAGIIHLRAWKPLPRGGNVVVGDPPKHLLRQAEIQSRNLRLWVQSWFMDRNVDAVNSTLESRQSISNHYNGARRGPRKDGENI